MLVRCAAIAVLLLLPTVLAKTVRGRFHLSAGDETHGPEYEIAKYSFAVGKSVIKGTIRYSANDVNWLTSPALYLFNDEKWPQYHAALACMDKVEHAHTVVQVGVTTDGSGVGQRSAINYGYNHLAKNTKAWSKTVGGMVEWSFEWTVEHTERTKGWFLIAADCALEQYNTKVAPMEYTITLLNPGENHLPADEHYLPTFYLIVFAGMVGFGVYGLMLTNRHMETSSKIHLVVKLLILAYIAQLVAIVFELQHQFIYYFNGSGIFFLDFFSEIAEGLSAFVISFVLICLACGWTLVEEEANVKKSTSVATILRDPKSMLRGGNWLGNLLAMGFIAIVVWSMFLIFYNKLSDEDFTKFHNHDTPSGRKLLYIRVGLFALFAFSIQATIRKLSKGLSSSPDLRNFLVRLLFLGSLWFLAFPSTVFLANISAHYYRHRIVVAGTLVLQVTSLCALGYQFLAYNSTYARLSTAWESGILPGAGGLIRGSKSRAAD